MVELATTVSYQTPARAHQKYLPVQAASKTVSVFLRLPSVERTKGERHALRLRIQTLVNAESHYLSRYCNDSIVLKELMQRLGEPSLVQG